VCVCFDFLYNVCLKHFSFYEEFSEIWSKMCIGLLIKYPLLLSDFNEAGIFSKKYLNIIFTKILSVGVELFHADRQA